MLFVVQKWIVGKTIELVSPPPNLWLSQPAMPKFHPTIHFHMKLTFYMILAKDWCIRIQTKKSAQDY